MNVQDWTAIAARYDDGATFEDLALDIGCSTAYVRARLAGLVTPRPKGQRAGKPQHVSPTRNATEGRGVGPAARIARPSVARMYR